MLFKGLFAGLVGTGCTHAPALKRGESRVVIEGEYRRVLEAEGFSCKTADSGTMVVCEHPKRPNFSFSYLPTTNLFQLVVLFNRVNDETLAPEWRVSCEEIAPRMNELNTKLVVQTSCTGDYIAMSTVVWVPSTGLSDQDLRDLTLMFGQVVATALNTGGLVAPR